MDQVVLTDEITEIDIDMDTEDSADREALEDLARLDGASENDFSGLDGLTEEEFTSQSDAETTALTDDEHAADEQDAGFSDGRNDVLEPDAAEDAAPARSGSVTVACVRFRTAGRIYYFDPGDFELKRGERVVVETSRGVEMGTIVAPPMEVDRKRARGPLRPILRIATQEDREHEAINRQKEREAYRQCAQRIRSRGLDMKLIDAEYTFDNSKILFYFTADGRVDFRDLVKDLAGVFHTRIELRQIGVRDETKILGGYGSCGRPLCCHSYLGDFVPVSIKMAKEQNLSLNPTKISGVCGRLMCCLKNEEDTYEELNKNLPHIGDEVETGDGMKGEVESVNVLRQRVRIIVDVDDEKELHEYAAEDVTVTRRRRRGGSKSKARPHVERGTVVRDKTGIRSEKAQSDAGNAMGQEQETAESGSTRAPREARRSREDRRQREDRTSREDRQSRGNRQSREDRQPGDDVQSREGRQSGRTRQSGEERQEKASRASGESRQAAEAKQPAENVSGQKEEQENASRRRRRPRRRNDRKDRGDN